MCQSSSPSGNSVGSYILYYPHFLLFGKKKFDSWGSIFSADNVLLLVIIHLEYTHMFQKTDSSLTRDTYAYVCVAGGKKYLFYG